MAADPPGWRRPTERLEQRPTVNVAATGLSCAVPRLHQHPDGGVSLEIVPGVALHDDITVLERLMDEAAAACRRHTRTHPRSGR